MKLREDKEHHFNICIHHEIQHSYILFISMYNVIIYTGHSWSTTNSRQLCTYTVATVIALVEPIRTIFETCRSQRCV